MHGWKLVSSELCGADADPLLAQLLCLVPPGTVQRVSVSVFREVIEVGEIFTVCSQVFMPLLFRNLQSQLSPTIFLGVLYLFLCLGASRICRVVCIISIFRLNLSGAVGWWLWSSWTGWPRGSPLVGALFIFPSVYGSWLFGD